MLARVSWGGPVVLGRKGGHCFLRLRDGHGAIQHVLSSLTWQALASGLETRVCLRDSSAPARPLRSSHRWPPGPPFFRSRSPCPRLVQVCEFWAGGHAPASSGAWPLGFLANAPARSGSWPLFLQQLSPGPSTPPVDGAWGGVTGDGSTSQVTGPWRLSPGQPCYPGTSGPAPLAGSSWIL